MGGAASPRCGAPAPRGGVTPPAGCVTKPPGDERDLGSVSRAPRLATRVPPVLPLLRRATFRDFRVKTRRAHPQWGESRGRSPGSPCSRLTVQVVNEHPPDRPPQSGRPGSKRDPTAANRPCQDLYGKINLPTSYRQIRPQRLAIAQSAPSHELAYPRRGELSRPELPFPTVGHLSLDMAIWSLYLPSLLACRPPGIFDI